MLDVMVDIETLGNGPRSMIVSIAAVKFNEDGPSPDKDDWFYERVERCDAAKYGEMTPATVKWWMQQSQAARESISGGTKPLRKVLREFQQWFPKDGLVWGNGPVFDVTIMEHAFKQADVKIPWHYRNVRDVRTIVDLTKEFMSTRDFEEDDDVLHDALSDAKYQARYVGAMMRRIRLALENPVTIYTPHLVGEWNCNSSTITTS
jgi:hypothetical protein